MILIETKTITLKAWKWNESREQFKQIGCKMLRCSGHEEEPDLMKNLKIETSDGKGAFVRKGDYIIQNFRGEYFVCDRAFFYENYILKASGKNRVIPEISKNRTQKL